LLPAVVFLSCPARQRQCQLPYIECESVCVGVCLGGCWCSPNFRGSCLRVLLSFSAACSTVAHDNVVVLPVRRIARGAVVLLAAIQKVVCVCVCVCGALLAALLSSAACVWQHRNELTAPLLRKICCDHWRVAMRPHHMHLLINIRARCVASAALHTHHNAANRVHSCPDTPITSQHIPPLCACARDNHTHCLSCIWMVLSCRALAARMMQPCYLPQAHRVVRGSMAVWAMACVLALWPV
jgi:hypothetical protein